MRGAGLIVCAMVAVLMTTPSLAATFTLDDALSVTYETNPHLDQARAALRALDQGVAQANAGWRPSINLSGSYGVSRGEVQGLPSAFNSHPMSAQVSITQSIFRGGRTFAEVGKAMAQVRAGRAQLASTEQSVLLAAVTAYVDVVRGTESVRLSRENIGMLQTELNAVRTEFSAGAVTRTDANQAEARLARAQADAAATEQQLAASRAAFENVVGRPAETLESMPHLPRLPATKDDALSIALRQNPDLLAAKATARAADYAVDDAAGALLPQVSVSGQYQYLRDSAGTNIFATKSPQQILSVVGQIVVPIYQGGGEEASVRRAKNLRQQSEIGIASAERDVRQNLDSAWQAFRSAEIAVTASEAEVTANRSAVDGVKQEQQAGERSVLDVLNAQQELFSAELSVQRARRDRIVSAFKVLTATGDLTARALRLNVRQYDPQAHYDDNAAAWVGFGD